MKSSRLAVIAATCLLMGTTTLVSAQNIAIVNGKAVPNARYDALAREIAKSGRPVTDEMKAQLGNLYDLVREHGSLADAVQASLTAGGLDQGDLSDLRSEMNSFSDDIRRFAASAKMSSEMFLSMISRIREK